MKHLLHLRHSLALAALAIFMLLPGLGKATSLLTDDFTGTVGTALTANGWTLHSGTATPFLISSPGLTYASYLGSGIGNAASTGGTSDDVNKAFTSTNSGSIYMSFMYKPTSANTTADYSVMLATTSGTSVSSFFGKFYVQRDASSNVRFGITKVTAGSAAYTGYSYSLGTTYLIVIRYDFVTGTGNDIASLFVNPVISGTEPSSTVTCSTDVATDPAQLVSVALRQSTSSAAAVYDGFRIGTTWADIAGVITPSISQNNTGFAQITADATPNPSVTKVVLSKFKADVTNANAVLNTLAFKTAGTYAPADISEFELYYSSNSTMPGTSLANTTTIPSTGGTVTFSSLATTINAGSSGYFWITCDIASGATASNTIGTLGTNASGLVLTFASGTPTGTIADPTLQTITASAAASQTITFGPLSNKTYGDSPFALGATASSGLTVTYVSSNLGVATISGNTVTIVGAGSTDITASQSGNISFLPAPDVTQSLLVNPLGLTVTGAVASNKTYDGNATAAITGATLVGVINSDDVTVSGGGTFSDLNVGTAIPVTAALILGGTKAGNYSLTQPTGLAADILIAGQIITFNSIPNKVIGSAPFVLTATASSGLTVSYVSSNSSVATVSGNTVTILGLGTTTITASQAGNGNYLPATDVLRTLTVVPLPIAAWDFYGVGSTSLPTFAATTFNSDLVSTSGANEVTRGATAAWSGAANSFRTTGFKNEGIDVSNTDYFEVTLQPSAGKVLSLNTIDAILNGTGTFCATPGVTSQFAYSLDGTTFTLIGSPLVTIGGPVSLPQIDLTGVSALQNINAGTTVTMRYYASGQTATGGWGYYSAASGTNGLAIGGTISNAVTTYSGTGNWSSAGNWSNGVPASSTDAIVDGDVTVDVAAATKSLTINSGKSVVVSNGQSLEVNGTFANNAGAANLVVKSGGSLIESNGVAATVERNITSNVYHSFSPSVGGLTANLFHLLGSTGLDVYLYSHNEALNANPSAGFFEITSVSTPLFPFAGYSVYADGANATPPVTSWTFIEQGNLNTGAYGYYGDMTRTGLGDDNSFAGFNYIGNPYPSFIDWTALSGWSRTSLNAAIYVENSGAWATFITPGPGTNGGSNIIAPGQGFFVRVSYGQTGGTLTMNNDVRTQTSTPYLKSSPANFVRLIATGNDKSDETVIRFDTDATSNFDGQYDAAKLGADDAAIPQIYSVANCNLAYNALPATDMVQLGFTAGVSGEYTIGINAVDGISAISLEDTQTGIFTDLTKNSYTFNAAPGDASQRFVLHFGPLTTITETENSVATVYASHGVVYVNMINNAKGDIYVYNIAGQLVAKSSASAGSNMISLGNTGNYIVKVISDKSTMVKKVFVQ